MRLNHAFRDIHSFKYMYEIQLSKHPLQELEK